MPRQRQRVPYEQDTKYEGGRMFNLREVDFSYRGIAARIPGQ